MSDSLGHRSLARAAARLALTARSGLPGLALMTDEDRLADPVTAARSLLPGSLVIARARTRSARARLVTDLLPIARLRELILVVADDEDLAREADGIHLPEAHACHAADMRARHPHWLVTAAIHGPRTILRSDADAFVLSPVFATVSHPNREPLSPVRAAAVARLAGRPVYALGGITARNALRLHGLGFSGIAAVSALI